MATHSWNIHDIYREYANRSGRLDAKRFREVCERFNSLVMGRLIDHGFAVDLGHGLSSLSVVRVERRFDKPRINWGASHKLRAELVSNGITPYDKEHNPDGQKWFVYFTQPHWFKFHWRKAKCRIPNSSVYKFFATRGEKGNKGALAKKVRSNPTAWMVFDDLKSLKGT